MLLICYPGCSTCKKAQAWLDQKGFAYTYRDIKQDNPSQKELAVWHQLSGLPLRRFFNTSGLSYRALHLKDRLDQMPENEQLKLLSEDGMLVKRPLLITGKQVLAGFREKEWAEALDQGV